jgi:transcriptional regulator with XRE-family HTH domain
MAQLPSILAHQLKAARSLARIEQKELSIRAGVSVPTIKRMEAGDGPVRGTYENVSAVVTALESAGVEFTNGDQPGVRLQKRPKESTGESKPPPGAKTAPSRKARQRPSVGRGKR